VCSSGPHLKKGAVGLKKIQRQSAKMLVRMVQQPCEERLKKLIFFSLERRVRGAVMKLHKITDVMD